MTQAWARVLTAAVFVRGADARRWCNGLFTNNVRDLPIGAWNRSAMVDDRGRVHGFLDLLCLADDQLLAVVDGMTPAEFLERHERYLLFDRVELTVPPLARFTVFGADGPAGARPGPGRWEAAAGGWAWGHRRAPGQTLDWVGPEGSWMPSGTELAAEALEVARVAAGIPRFPDDTTEKCLPHELGLRDELLHFEKGCYLGQETIHRVDVMGQVRRRLVRVATPRPVAAGSEVRVDGAVVGLVSSPVELEDGSGLGLALVRVPHDGPGTSVEVGEFAGSVA